MNIFALQLFGEFQKLFARKRTYIGFGVFLVVEIVVLFLLRLPRVQRGMTRLLEGAGYVAESYLSGITLGLMILLSTVFLLGALYLALVAGDIVSKEVEDGTMRMILSRPSSRSRMLLLKLIVCCGYTVLLTLFIACTALAAGYFHAGSGGLFVFAPTEGVFAIYSASEGFVRLGWAVSLLAVSLCTITCLGFCCSCFRMKPAAATIITLSILFVDTILKNLPFFSEIREWFLTSKMSAWVLVFSYQVPWERIVEQYAWLLGINVSLLVLGWIIFEYRDFKS